MAVRHGRSGSSPGGEDAARLNLSTRNARNVHQSPQLRPDRPGPRVIFDTTLRDGEQSPGFSMNLEEKLRMAEALHELGADVLEAGFAIASPGDFEERAVHRQALRQGRPGDRQPVPRQRRG